MEVDLVHMHAYRHTCMYAYIHIQSCMSGYIYTYMYTLISACTHMFTYMHMYTHIYPSAYIHTYLNAYNMYVWMLSFINVCIHTYIMTHGCVSPYIHTYINAKTHASCLTYMTIYIHMYIHWLLHDWYKQTLMFVYVHSFKVKVLHLYTAYCTVALKVV